MHEVSKLILVINCGSSSLKFGLFNGDDLSLLFEGLASALNSSQSSLKINNILLNERTRLDCSNHREALACILEFLGSQYDLEAMLSGIGHRVVHGGEHFKSSTLIDDAVLRQIKACIPLAPLHNPANLEGITLSAEQFPGVPQVAVFDTAFHQSMPENAFIYPLPYQLYRELHVRRYGFHGSSHRFVSRHAGEYLRLEAESGNFITAHLGNGASICAIRNGRSVDTSMGMTPLEGLVMGTRSGDIDPGIFDYLSNQGYSIEAINAMLNRESGLLGISGQSNDMRTLQEKAEQGDPQCRLAIDIFCYRLAKYIAAMMVPLDSLDALIFTGGIGENSAAIRAQTIRQLALLGFAIDDELNAASAASDDCFEIQATESKRILVVKTDEEKMIAEDTKTLVSQRQH